MTAYDDLEKRFSRLTHLERVASLLRWDKAVMMPPSGAQQRADQMAVLHGLMHDIKTASETADLLGEAEAQKESLNEWQQANLRIMHWKYDHATALPQELVERETRHSILCEMTWRQAKQDSDFSAVQQPLEEMVAITRDVAAAKGQKMGLAPYDALMDRFGPGNRMADIDGIFDDLVGFLPGFIDRVIDRQAKKSSIESLKGPFTAEKQKELCRCIAEKIGFDFKAGRIDVSAHPFSSGTGQDVRITVRHREDDFLGSLMAVMHEVGHALYNQRAAAALPGQPVSIAGNMGMAVHESQSLSVENQLGMSRAFWTYAAPICREALGRGEAAFDADNLWRAATRVERSLIRVDADEVTYPLHIVLRYRLEKALMADDLQVADIPSAWNDQMQKLLGITPPDDRHGCLQDIHWFNAEFGYFPAYALGAMIAAQFASKMRVDIPDLDKQVASGNPAVFTQWLGRNVHQKAGLYTPQDLIKQVTGKPLSAEAFKAHLTARYLEDAEMVRSVA